MNYRQHKAIRFEQLLWITNKPGKTCIDFLSNKYIPSRESELYACISSRITTGIHVVSHLQINNYWYNELYAVSLYKDVYT
jgi:hypothetical protein